MTCARDGVSSRDDTPNTRTDASNPGRSTPLTRPICHDAFRGLCVPFVCSLAGVGWVSFLYYETREDLFALDCERLRFFGPVMFAYLLGFLHVAVSFRPRRQERHHKQRQQSQQELHRTLIAFKHRALFSSLCLLFVCLYFYGAASVGYPLGKHLYQRLALPERQHMLHWRQP